MDAAAGGGDSAVVLGGRYELGPLVGIGGTAHVHRAWDREQGCAVAVKVFEPGDVSGPGRGGGWEMAVLTGLQHPGLVAVHGGGVDARGRLFVVMDLVDGETLGSRLRAGPLPTATVVRLGGGIAAALAHVHGHGVVHRDLKPGNILLDREGRPRLTDFGIARIIDGTRVTATGVVVGTAAYMAPEQVRGENVGPAADVYALGLVLLEAVTGHREYEGGALESAVARLHRSPRVPAQVPDPLATLIRRMTALEPAERPSASDVAAVLDPTSAARPACVPAPGGRVGGAGGRPLARVGRRLAPAAALACLVVAALGGGSMVLGADHPSSTSAGAPTWSVAAPTGDAPTGSMTPAGDAPQSQAAPGPSPRRAAAPVVMRLHDGGGRAGQQSDARSSSKASRQARSARTEPDRTASRDKVGEDADSPGSDVRSSNGSQGKKATSDRDGKNGTAGKDRAGKRGRQ